MCFCAGRGGRLRTVLSFARSTRQNSDGFLAQQGSGARCCSSQIHLCAFLGSVRSEQNVRFPFQRAWRVQKAAVVRSFARNLTEHAILASLREHADLVAMQVKFYRRARPILRTAELGPGRPFVNPIPVNRCHASAPGVKHGPDSRGYTRSTSSSLNRPSFAASPKSRERRGRQLRTS